MDNNSKEVIRTKLEALDTSLVEQIVFDILHLKSEKFKYLNTGQHEEYTEIVQELKNRYESQLKRVENGADTV